MPRIVKELWIWGFVITSYSIHYTKLYETDLDFYGNVISDDGVKAIASSPYMKNLKKLSLYGNLVEDDGAIAIAESATLAKLKHLFLTSNRVRRAGLEALTKVKSRHRLCHLHIDDLSYNFV